MKTNDLLLIGGACVAAYLIFGNKSNIDTYSGGGGSGGYNQTPSVAPSYIPTPNTPTPTGATTGNIKGVDNRMSIATPKNNSYNSSTGVLVINNQGFSVAPQNAAKMAVTAPTPYINLPKNPFA